MESVSFPGAEFPAVFFPVIVNIYRKIIFNRYKTEAEAYNALREMREYTEFHEAWVYQVKD